MTRIFLLGLAVGCVVGLIVMGYLFMFDAKPRLPEIPSGGDFTVTRGRVRK